MGASSGYSLRMRRRSLSLRNGSGPGRAVVWTACGLSLGLLLARINEGRCAASNRISAIIRHHQTAHSDLMPSPSRRRWHYSVGRQGKLVVFLPVPLTYSNTQIHAMKFPYIRNPTRPWKMFSFSSTTSNSLRREVSSFWLHRFQEYTQATHYWHTMFNHLNIRDSHWAHTMMEDDQAKSSKNAFHEEKDDSRNEAAHVATFADMSQHAVCFTDLPSTVNYSLDISPGMSTTSYAGLHGLLDIAFGDDHWFWPDVNSTSHLQEQGLTTSTEPLYTPDNDVQRSLTSIA